MLCQYANKDKTKKKPLSEFLNGCFTEHREEWQKELQRYCEEVYTDQDDTREVQEKRIEHFKKKGDRHFTDDGRGAEITVDLVLLVKAQMSENKVNGQEDAVVTEMIKQLLVEEIFICCEVFSGTLMGQMDAPSSWKIVRLVSLRKPDAEPKKRDQKPQGHHAKNQ